MIQFRLEDGSVVAAAQDCECLNHAGPHWLHMDSVRKASSRRLLEAGNVQGHVVEELARLREKEWQMRQRRVVEIIR